MQANHRPRARTAGAWAGDLKVFGDASAEYLERDPTAKERLPTHLHVLLGCTDALCFNKNAENNYKNEEHTARLLPTLHAKHSKHIHESPFRRWILSCSAREITAEID